MMRSAEVLGLRILIVICCLLCLATCTQQQAAENPDGKSKATAPSQAAAVSAGSSAIKASEDDCVGPLVKAAKPREVVVGERKFVVDGYRLTQQNRDPDQQITLGILSDTKEKNEENIRNLEEILRIFRAEKVEAIIHLGDIASMPPLPEDIDIPEKDEKGNLLTDEQKNRFRRRVISEARRESMTKSYNDMVEMISVLAESEVPVLVISGNRECKTTFNSAMATLAQDFPNVFNMNFIRFAELDDVDIVSMPGYHDPEYVHCAWDKCLYYESDTLALQGLAAEAKQPILLISHGPPRQNDRNGIDAVSEGANVGNPALVTAVVKAGIRFGAFGNIQEAGGKATTLDGTSIIPQDTFTDSLFLNPGPADSMIWPMNDGTESRGMAAVVTIVGNKAKYRVFRMGEKRTMPTESEETPTPASVP